MREADKNSWLYLSVVGAYVVRTSSLNDKLDIGFEVKHRVLIAVRVQPSRPTAEKTLIEVSLQACWQFPLFRRRAPYTPFL